MEVVHLNQKQLAARWSISEASLERWRSEGIGSKFLKSGGDVVGAQGKALFFAVDTVLEAPPLAPGRGDLQIHAATISESVGFVLRFGIANCGV